MGLTFAKTSKKALKALEEGMKFMPGQLNQATLLKTARKSQPASLPHKTYVLALEDMAAGTGLEKAQLIGWEQIMDGHAIVVHSNENNDSHTFAEIHQGVHLPGILKKLEVMKNHKKVVKGNYEVAILSVPALFIKALWLKAEKPEEDLIVPIEPTHPILSQHHQTVFSPAEFVALLQQEASLNMQSDFAPVGAPDQP